MLDLCLNARIMTQKETVTYYLKNQEVDKALAFAKEIKLKKNKMMSLELIIANLLENQTLEQALKVAQWLPDERKQAAILKKILQQALAKRLPNLAYRAAQEMLIPRSQSAALRLLADYYVENKQLKKAFSIASEIKTLKTQTTLLKGMSERLVENNLMDALNAADRIKDIPVKLRLIEKLTHQTIQQYSVEKAINAVIDFKDPLSKIWLWTIVSKQLSEKKSRPLLSNALKIAESLTKAYEKSLALTQVAFYIAQVLGQNTKVQKLLHQALDLAKKIWKDEDKQGAILKICKTWIAIAQWDEAIRVVEKYVDRVDIVGFLSQLEEQLATDSYPKEAQKVKELSRDILKTVAQHQKIKRLIKVSNEKPSQSRYYYYYGYDDDNKFYLMTDNEDGTFTVEYGRIGESYADTYTYPIQEWGKKYKEKLRKGYKDVTYMYEKKNEAKEDGLVPIEQPGIAQLVKELQQFAQQSVTDNYTVNAQNVTITQLDEAQRLVDEISGLVELMDHKMLNPRREIDDLLLKLFTVIPRKMNVVEEYLTEHLDDNQSVKQRIAEEQATLDVMRGEVLTYQNTIDHQNQHITLLEAMGIKIETAELSDILAIRQLMGNKYFEDYFQKAYKVTNLRTQANFDHKVEDTRNRRTKLLWHGSRNENWWSILKTGLILRPSNAVITGKMFGYGLYFADKVKKSMGYSSLYGSFWTSGESNKAYLAIYEVHLGNCLRRRSHEYWMYELTEDLLREKGNYDSLFARGGADLLNNEYIVYNEAQCTIKYLVEIHS